MMKWIKDKQTGNFICDKCGLMVRHNGYGGCDYKLCPYCGREVQEGKQNEDKN